MMPHLFLNVKQGKTVYLDFSELSPEMLANGIGTVALTLVEQRGRMGRFEFSADERVFIDLHPRNSVKLATET
jgi:hypothetical protein